MIQDILKYAGGAVILIAGLLAGYLRGRGHETRRRTREYNRQRAKYPSATKRNYDFPG